jgi:hypothetical protein
MAEARSIGANINGAPGDSTFGVYLQSVEASGEDRIAHLLPSTGGTATTSIQTAGSQTAAQAERPFTTVFRYNLAGQVTGTISPDPDGDGPLKYLATRNTYERGLLVRCAGRRVRWIPPVTSRSTATDADSKTIAATDCRIDIEEDRQILVDR